MVTSISGGIDWVAVGDALQAWVTAASGLPSTSVTWWGQQQAPRVQEPAISMRLTVTSTQGQPWHYIVDNPLVLGTLTVSAVSTGAGTLTIANHGLVTGDGPVQLAGALPAPLLTLTNYWVIVIDANTIRLAATFANTGGAPGPGNTNPITPIALTTTGSGTITLASTSGTLRAGQELLFNSQILEKCTLTLECYTSAGIDMNGAVAVLHRIVSRQVLPSVRQILANANIGMTDVRNVRSINGRKDAVLFEPRAMLDVWINLPSSESEALTSITTADVTGTVANPPGSPLTVVAVAKLP